MFKMTLAENKKAYTAWTLDEVREILRSAEEFDIKNLFRRAFITTWVLASNCSLRMLKFLFFKKRGYAKREFKNIVVYTVGIVGDNIVMLPALAALRRRYAKAKITVITNCQIWDQNGAKEVLSPSPFKDNLIILNDHPIQRKGFQFLMDKAKLNGLQCDLFVNLSPFGNRGLIGAVVREMIFARRLGAKYAIGFCMSTYSRRDIFNEVQYRFVKNEPRRSREVLEEIGLDPTEAEDLLPHDPVAKESVMKKIKEQIGDDLSLLVINPGAKLESKCWPPEYFAEIAKWFNQNYNGGIVVTGLASENQIAEKIVKASGDFAINFAGKTTIQELTELLRISKCCVTNDTGTMHIAAMVGVPTVSLFSLRFSPTHWFPAGQNIVSIFSVPGCIYCYEDSCERLDCLKNIRVDDVILGLRKVMDVG